LARWRGSAKVNVGPVWSLITSLPWIFGLFMLGSIVVVSQLYLRIRWAHLSLRGRDLQRRFTGKPACMSDSMR